MPSFLLTTLHLLLLLATSSLQQVSAQTDTRDTSQPCGTLKHPRIFPKLTSRRGLIRSPRFIWDGHKVTISENPWMVQLKSCRGSRCWKCSGSIINSRYVLTAAHCLFEAVTQQQYLPNETRVGVGRTKWSPGRDNVKAERFFTHEGYVHYKVSPAPHDIALIKLATPLDLGQDKDKVPICLPDSNQAGDDVKNSFRHCRVAGWGKARNDEYDPDDPDNDKRSYNPKRLLEVDLTVSSRRECSDYLRRQNFPEEVVRGIDFENTSLCAGAADIRMGGKDACDGDSGGPLVCQGSGGAWVQAGVVSFGPNTCGEKNSYGVYEDVSKYLDWINNIIGGD